MTTLSRRLFVQLASASALMSGPAAFAQTGSERKFLFVILRGAMDGLAALIPDDQEVEALRGAILPDPAQRLDLGNGFRLHPNLTQLNTLYHGGDAAFIHAAATPFRGRSHFDGQDALESLDGPGAKTGWLNRALSSINVDGLAVGYSVPLALRGPAAVTNWSPPVFEDASETLVQRLSALYANDPVFSVAMASQNMVPENDMTRMRGRGRTNYTPLLTAAGELMIQPGGPNVAMVSLEGWDTHVNQAGALDTRFTQLDQALGALKTTCGEDWSNMCVVLCSEFGRTAAVNGTRGTDHGTGGLVTLLGGAVKGGKVYGDWPGLKQAQLHENRDLAPANDIGAVLKGVMRDHMGLDRAALDTAVFPGSARAFDNLVI